MPSCYAKGCRNSSDYGIKMSYFPKNPQRRELWTSNCKKFNAITYTLPSDHAVLCEYHFTADMWEKPRVDGKKKLKSNAVPTIFGDSVFQVKKKKRQDVPANVNHLNTFTVHTNPHTKGFEIWTTSGQKYKMLLVNGPVNEAIKSIVTANSSKDSHIKESEEVSIIEDKNTSLRTNSNTISRCTEDATLSEVFKNANIPNNPNDHISNGKLQTDSDSDTDSFIDKNFEPITDEEIETTEEDYENFEPVTDDEMNFDKEDNLSTKETNLKTHVMTEEHRTYLSLKRLNKSASKKTDTKCSRCEKLEKECQNSERLRIMMKRNVQHTFRIQKRKIQLLENKIRVLESNYEGLHKILNEDQINFLGKGSKKMYKWSEETLKKANDYKLTFGIRGYKYLLNYNWPLPTIRTLRAKLEKKKSKQEKL